MTVWIYAVDNGGYDEVATVENGSVIDGDEGFVTSAFEGDIPTEEEVAREFDGTATVSTTDFEMDWDEPNPELADGDTDFRLEEFESWLDDVHENFVKAEETDKTLTQFNEGELPEMVIERLRQAIMGGSVFSDIESISSSQRQELQTFLMDALSDDEWSLDNLASELSDNFGVSEDRAELIARSETQSAVNAAAEDAYEDLEEERGEEFRYKWVGNIDSRTTQACEWLLNKTNPKFGGNPVSLEELKDLIQEAPEHDDSLDDNMARTWAPHPGCRKRYVRVVE